MSWGVVVVLVDLHCHTRISDGSTSVDELLFMAKRMGVTTLAITDHDNFAGSKRGITLSKRYGVNVIFGVEFSSFSSDLDTELHILCYMCDFPDRLEGLCLRNANARRKSILEIVNQIVKYYPVSMNSINMKARGSSNIFRTHIIQSVLDTGFVTPVFSVAYDKIFGARSKIVCSQPEYAETAEVISQIHQAGGLAILAHPNDETIDKVLPYVMSLGIDGVEAFHPFVSSSLCDRVLKLSDKYELLVTGGSDFHGMYTSRQRYLGIRSTPVDYLDKMQKRKVKMSKLA